MSKLNDSSRAKARPKRIPLRDQSDLAAPSREGFVRRWVNDRNDRIEMFQQAGWALVDSDLEVGDKKTSDPSSKGSMNRKVVNKATDGLEAVLMEIPEGFYNEDQQAKAEENARIMQNVDPNFSNIPGSYGQIKTDIKKT